jgi:Bacterial archaeo-eukaryotic release factor family 3
VGETFDRRNVYRKEPFVNHALLTQLQRLRSYPSVTVLVNTTPRQPLTETERKTLETFVSATNRRLQGDVSLFVRKRVVERLEELVTDIANDPASHAVALCVSPDYSAVVRLGRAVEERVIVDDTFATRDLVADLNRTAHYRVITISDRKTRLLVGDRQRLMEERGEGWPIERAEGQNAAAWTKTVMQALQVEHQRNPLPTVVAGVERSVRRTLALADLQAVGLVAGNHDRTGWSDLHSLSWPLVTDWLRADGQRAMEQLDSARSTRLYAGGIHELWPLAREGRIDLVVVEETYSMAARVFGETLEPTEDVEAPDVVDDVVDEMIEAVLRHGGKAVIVNDGELADHQRIAGVLRY